MKKALIVLGLIVLLLVGWGVGLAASDEEVVAVNVQPYIDLALEQETLGAYGVVVQCREQVVALQPTLENYLVLAQTYKDAGRTAKYKTTMLDIVDKFPTDPRAYEELAGYYSNNGRYQDCVDLVKRAANNGIRTAALNNLYFANAYKFAYLGTGYDEAYRFYNGSALVKKHDVYSYVSTDLEVLFGGYKEAKSMFESVVGVQDKNGECYFVSGGGTKYMDTLIAYEELGAFKDGVALTVSDGKYGYLTKQNQQVLGTFDEATVFTCGVAAVRQGEQWKIMNSQGYVVGDPSKSYKDVLVDEDNICSWQNRIFVSDGEGYYMIDVAGNRIGETVYEDAQPFFNYGYAAVKLDGKWGFVDVNGTMVIAPQYSDARSFGLEIAAVKQYGQWGFISAGNRMVIDPQFEDVKNFSSDGIAPVKKDGAWGYIRLMVSR